MANSHLNKITVISGFLVCLTSCSPVSPSISKEGSINRTPIEPSYSRLRPAEVTTVSDSTEESTNQMPKETFRAVWLDESSATELPPLFYSLSPREKNAFVQKGNIYFDLGNILEDKDFFVVFVVEDEAKKISNSLIKNGIQPRIFSSQNHYYQMSLLHLSALDAWRSGDIGQDTKNFLESELIEIRFYFASDVSAVEMGRASKLITPKWLDDHRSSVLSEKDRILELRETVPKEYKNWDPASEAIVNRPNDDDDEPLLDE